MICNPGYESTSCVQIIIDIFKRLGGVEEGLHYSVRRTGRERHTARTGEDRPNQQVNRVWAGCLLRGKRAGPAAAAAVAAAAAGLTAPVVVARPR